MIHLNGDAADESRGGGPTLAGVFGIDFGMAALYDAKGAIANSDFARLPVKLEEKSASTIGMSLADGEEFDDHGFAGLDFHGDFLSRFQTVEKCGRRQNAYVGISLAELVVLQEHFRVEKVAEQGVAAYGMSRFLLKFCLFVVPIHGSEAGAGPALHWSLAAQDDALQLLRPATRRDAECTGKHFYDGVRQRNVVALVEQEQIGGVYFVCEKK